MSDYVLSKYHSQLDAQARHLIEVNSRLAYARLTRPELSSWQCAEIAETIRVNSAAAERLRAQIAWERWFGGEPQIWRPSEPSWRN